MIGGPLVIATLRQREKKPDKKKEAVLRPDPYHRSSTTIREQLHPLKPRTILTRALTPTLLGS
jgi:hypothetical protein